jgi:RHS repeat-associated protein
MRYQYTGREFDADTGLYFYRARWYSAELGRFVSEDPIGFAGGDVNLYGYVENNPVRFTDSTGLWKEPLDAETIRRVTQTAVEIGRQIGPTAGATGAVTAGTAELGLATGVGAASASTVGAVVVGGFGAGFAIGIGPGIWLSEQRWNPFVYGSLNPFGNPNPEPQTG